MKSYIVEFQVEKQGSTKQRTTVQAELIVWMLEPKC